MLLINIQLLITWEEADMRYVGLNNAVAYEGILLESL